MFVEGCWDLEFFTQVLLKLKRFSPDPPLDTQAARIRSFVRGDNFKTLTRGETHVHLVQCRGKDNVRRQLANTATDFAGSGMGDLCSLAIVDSDRGAPQDVRSGVLARLEQKMSKRGFGVARESPGESMSACTVSKQSKSLKVGVMTICPNLDELLVNFAKARKIYSPRKPTGAGPKQILRYIMHDWGQDDAAGFCGRLFSEHQDEIRGELANRHVLGELCEFIE